MDINDGIAANGQLHVLLDTLAKISNMVHEFLDDAAAVAEIYGDTSDLAVAFANARECGEPIALAINDLREKMDQRGGHMLIAQELFKNRGTGG